MTYVWQFHAFCWETRESWPWLGSHWPVGHWQRPGLPSGTLVQPNSYMNSWNIWIHIWICISWYEFIYIWIHIIVIWIHVWNDYMNSYTSEFIYEMKIWIHEDMNSCIWIQMYGFWVHLWIHKYMNSDIRIHHIQSEFMNLISLLWIHRTNSLLK